MLILLTAGITVATGNSTAEPRVPPTSPSAPTVLATSDGRVHYLDFPSGHGYHISLDAPNGHGFRQQLPPSGIVWLESSVPVETYDGSLRIVATGTDGSLWTTAQRGRNGSWADWSKLGGPQVHDAPAVIRGAGDAVSVFVAGSDGAVWTLRQQAKDGPWGTWESLGGTGLSNPVTVGRGVGDAFEVVATSWKTKTLWKASQAVAGGPYSTWQQFSDSGFHRHAQLITHADRSMELVVRTQGGQVATKRQTSPRGSWAPWSTLTGPVGTGKPAVILRPDGRLSILAGAEDGRLFAGRFGFDPTTGMTTADQWDELTGRDAPRVLSDQAISGTGRPDGSWIAVYNDRSEKFAEIVGNYSEPAQDQAEPAPPALRSLPTVRAEDGGSGQYAEGVNAVRQVGPTGWTPPAFQYEHFTYDECTKTADVVREHFSIKNRYSSCWAADNTVHFKMACHRVHGEDVCYGRRITFTVTVIGLGSDYYRQGRFAISVSRFEHVLPVDEGLRVSVEARCLPQVETTDCESDPDTPPVQRTIAEWMNNKDARGDVIGHEPRPNPVLNPEQLGYGKAYVRVKVHRQDGSFKQVDSVDLRLRFDSAGYMSANGKSGTIFPDVDPVMNFPINTPEFAAMRESGLHYKQAMEHPEQTIPAVTGKSIPGAIGGSPLHRLKHNDRWREENRDEALRTCRSSEMPPGEYPRDGYQCDEYPFASTHEGASRTYNPQRNFSVKSIPEDDNSASGTWIGTWYSYDRIIDGDHFYVRVIE
ncbi:NucA/NucB deoxyribonuclease domain-containing protein [Actinosynnema sp. CS-041913]|uniref:NucA/NucB deoxyribonuclease domain-containing protein n=1 Tax=Actinosynnema sp. CS-041913 TaxID=3239917 RepID=UPI003D8D2C00